MRILASPLKGDPQVISGESGAGVGIGAVSLLMEKEEYEEVREKLKLDERSVILIINTEGDTDPERYREIVWDGAYSSVWNKIDKTGGRFVCLVFQQDKQNVPLSCVLNRFTFRLDKPLSLSRYAKVPVRNRIGICCRFLKHMRSRRSLKPCAHFVLSGGW